MDNSVTVVGTLGKAPELKYTASGQAVTSFSLAVTQKWLDKQTQEWKEKTSWLDCVTWRELAENVAESLTKGSRAIVIGKLEQQTWDDKETGAKRSKVQIVADDVAPSLRFATAVSAGAQRETPQDKNASNQSGGSISGWSTEDLEAPF